MNDEKIQKKKKRKKEKREKREERKKEGKGEKKKRKEKKEYPIILTGAQIGVSTRRVSAEEPPICRKIV